MNSKFYSGAVRAAIILLLFNSPAHGQSYDPFNLSDRDIQTILQQTVTIPSSSHNADISFLCADMKYHNGMLKFCELGDAIYMSFTRDMRLEINGDIKQLHAPGWGIFWHYLKQFNIPVWFVGFVRNRNALAFDEYEKLAGRYVPNLHTLKQDPTFQNILDKNFKPTGNINDYKGIIITCARTESERDGAEILEFKQQHPEFIFVNKNIRPIVTRKDVSYQTFCDAGLSYLIPRTKIYEKQYSPKLVDEIMRTFTSNYIVLKPLAGTCSRGVTIIEKQELDQTLALILMQDKKKLRQSTKIPWLTEWSVDTEPKFMVSEYVPSQTLMRDNNPYDPTMRMMCMLRHDQGAIHVTIIGTFWKIPALPLTSAATLTEKHVTRAHLVMTDPDAFHSGIMVDRETMQRVSQILHNCMPILYKHVLEHYA